MSPTDAAELALQALVDCHRDANWIVDAALTEAMSRVLVDGWEESLHLVNKAIHLRSAIAQRIAIVQPLIATAIAEREKADREDGLAVTH